jgi:hypothetical protein
MNLFTFFVKKIAIKRARPPHAKLRDTTLMEVVLHGYAISGVHGSGNIVQVVVNLLQIRMLKRRSRGREQDWKAMDQERCCVDSFVEQQCFL